MPLLSVSAANVRMHPVVLLQICDAYIRRKEDQERVIGTLLGTSVDGQIEVKSCYVVPHNESADQVRTHRVQACSSDGAPRGRPAGLWQPSRGWQPPAGGKIDRHAPCAPLCATQVAVDIVHHKTMYELHMKVSPAEVLVGW